ncbi:MAG: hypothetical protein M5U18_08070 [Dehalococcoidia bacterium]|nr:hypothetical protein [Dehalococcoidia bacterium]
MIEGPFHLPPLGGEGLARRIGEVEDVVPGDLLEFAQVEEQAVAIFEGEEGLLEGGSIGFEGGLAEGVEDSVRVGLRVPGGAGKPPGVPGGAAPRPGRDREIFDGGDAGTGVGTEVGREDLEIQGASQR